MKKRDLKEFIKSRVREAITIKTGKVLTPQEQSRKIDQMKISTSDPTIGTEKNPINFIKEDETPLNEMARTAAVFSIDPDFRNISKKNIRTGGPISPKKLEAVLDFLEGKETTSGPEIAAGVGFAGQMPRIYPIFAALIDSGALYPKGENKNVNIPDTSDNEEIDDILKNDEEDEPSTSDGPLAGTESKTAAEFISANSDLIKTIIRFYKGSRSRIGHDALDESNEFAKYTQTLQQDTEANYDKFRKSLGDLTHKMRTLTPESQKDIMHSLYAKLEPNGLGYIVRLLANKLKSDITLTKPEKKEDEVTPETEDIPIEDNDDIVLESVKPKRKYTKRKNVKNRS